MSSSRQVQSVDNTELYNRWAKLCTVYDTDGNILQAIDDLLLPSLLVEAFQHIRSSDAPITVIELGCGTGRNTAKLLDPQSPLKALDGGNCKIEAIHALDLSPGMLEVAKKRCEDLASSSTLQPPTKLQFLEFDALKPSNYPEVAALSGEADLVLSTLVLEHLPVDSFFSTVKQFLKPGGVLVLTNMHSEMGNISQAGFVDEETGEKIRGTSFGHTVGDVINGGKIEGFEVTGTIIERGITESDVDGGVVGLRGKKWVGVKVWYGCVMRLGEPSPIRT